ncbi:RDD family protein [Saccharopolyspora sp. WRP15-2]|uniref:RDD family protein n=1 Tax=Saccharopolyspora oryzae TaxID=2997343 RepID=A0ABT4UYK9_9PSEU|nr:RDD family protein [Saccharopolyspora oryzae]MDA3626809.1 RDD family protein [Saccharopolyspora oryzae]
MARSYQEFRAMDEVAAMQLPAEFRRAEAEYASLKQQVAAGQMSTAKFEAALLETMVKHEHRFWMLGANSGRWYVHGDAGWAEAEPPTIPSARTAEPPAQPPAMPATRTAEPAATPTAGTAIGPPHRTPSPPPTGPPPGPGAPPSEPAVHAFAEPSPPSVQPPFWPPPAQAGAGDVCVSCGIRAGAGPTCPACHQVHGLPAGVRLSSRGKRLVASLLEPVLFVVTLGIGWFVWMLIAWARGTTPAKQLLRMRVIWVANRRAATWGRMFLRDFFARGAVLTVIGILTLGIGWLVAILMIFGRTRRPLWDRMASTLVVDGYVDNPPQAPPALADGEAASYARKDRILAVAGVASVVLLIAGDALFQQMLANHFLRPFGPASGYAGLQANPEFTPPGPAAPVPNPQPPPPSPTAVVPPGPPPTGPAAVPPVQAPADMSVSVAPEVAAQPGAMAAATGLGTYFAGIDTGNFDLSWATLTPGEQHRLGDKTAWVNELQQTRDTDVTVYRLQRAPDGTQQASVRFTSHQPARYGPDGDTCDHWDLTYTLVPRGNISLIDEVAPTHGGSGHTTC